MSSIASLQLHNFRCYEQARFKDLPSGLIVLYGPNGAGKTNVLEAISLLSPGRGLRGAKISDIQKTVTPHPIALTRDHPLPLGEGGGPRSGEGEGPWAISAHIQTPFGNIPIGTGLDPQNETKRIIRINGVNAKSQAALAEYLSCIWLTPQMDRLFLDGAAERRKFLDRFVFAFDPSHAGRLTRYENALRQRSRLLQDGGADPAWLTALETQMAQTGMAIAAARQDCAQQLQKSCAAAPPGPFPRAQMSVIGTLENLLANAPALEVETLFAYQLKESRARDAQTGGAATGPHKSDLSVYYQGKDMPADQCSTGEQKALLIGLVLAHARLTTAEKKNAPLLLLDEIAAHLDESRRAALYEILQELGGQVWLTGTDRDLFKSIEGRAQFFHIQEGKIL